MSKQATFYCVRVYADLSAKETRRDDEGLKSWLEVNSTFRPGCALFIDGKLAGPENSGSLAREEVEAIEAALQNEIAGGKSARVRLEVKAMQTEYFCGRRETYEGYPADLDREGFDEAVDLEMSAVPAM